jgi:pimeloyl-ACP methyl ester carboxylesterase
MDKLAAEHDVVAVDLPGFGASAFEGRYDVPLAVARLTRFFTELGLERPHIVGNSLGGLLALEIGAAGDVASVTAISPAGMWNRRQRAYTLSVLVLLRVLSRVPKFVIRAFLKTSPTRRVAGFLLYGKPQQVDPEVFMADILAFRAGKGFWPVFR